MRHIRLLPLVAALLAGCTEESVAPLQPNHAMDEARPAAGKAAKHARAELRDVQGTVIGTARFTQDGTGRVHLTVHARGLTPGLHGMHLHEDDLTTNVSPDGTGPGRCGPRIACGVLQAN